MLILHTEKASFVVISLMLLSVCFLDFFLPLKFGFLRLDELVSKHFFLSAYKQTPTKLSQFIAEILRKLSVGIRH